MCFGQKVKTQQQQHKHSKIKPLPDPGIEPGTCCTQSGCVTTAPPSQLRISIVAKPCNCFAAMVFTVNKWIFTTFKSIMCKKKLYF